MTPRRIQFSEIRLVRGRHRRLAFGVVFFHVLCTDIFHPVAQRAAIGYDPGPWRGEGAFILDGKLQLQVLALVVGVEVDWIYARRVALIFSASRSIASLASA